MKKLVLASNNPGKLKEFSTLLQPLQFDVIPQGTLNIPEAEEPFETFVENALAKARHASQHSQLPALADDSGICVDALNGRPGVLSARYAGEPKSDQRNYQHLLQQMQPHEDRAAFYYCVLVLVRYADDPCPLIADGRWHGQIARQPAGDGGFGYDPVFYLPRLDKTSAQLAPEDKRQINHRGQATRKLLDRLQQESAVIT